MIITSYRGEFHHEIPGNRWITRKQLLVKGRIVRNWFTVLFFALLILFVRKIPWIAHALGALPVLGASMPFFLLSLGVLVWSLRNGRSLVDFGLHMPHSILLTFVWGVGAGLFRLLNDLCFEPCFNATNRFKLRC